MEENIMKVHQILLIGFLLLCSSMVTTVSLAQEAKTGVLPKKAKLEVILYEEADMIGIGYVYKKQFVENQQVSFLSKAFRDKNFSSYRIKERNGNFYLYERKSGAWEKISSLKTFISGIYFIKNDTSYIKGIMQPYDGITCEGVFMFCNIEYNNKYFLSPSNKDCRQFSYGISDSITYQVRTRDGYKVYGKSQDDGYSLRIDFPDESQILSFESSISSLSDLRNLDFYRSFPIEELKYVNVRFANGDSFSGTVTSSDSKGIVKVVPDKGKYCYKTGETHMGKYSKIEHGYGRIFVPNGIITFKDGVVASKDWLSKYNFTNDEWSHIYKTCNGLTEIRDMAVRLDQMKRQRLLEQQQEERRLELEKQRVENERRQRCISKYGDYYGNLIIKKEFALGMSKEMVRELLGEAEKLYKKSISTYLGHTIEIWSFNTEMVAQGVSFGGLLGALSYNRGLALQQKCPTLEFTDGKITSIYR